MSDILTSRSDVGEFRKRYKWLALFVSICFVAVVVRLFQLQIVGGDDYAKIAHENIIRKITVPTTRGVIRDSQGKVLASSRPSFNVYVVPGRVAPSARPLKNGEPVTDEPDSWPKIVEVLRLNPEEKTTFDASIHTACATDDDKSPCWHPILVREDVSRDVVAELKQHQQEMVGAEVVEVPVRFYPYKNIASHTVGYVAEIDAETLGKFRPEGWDSMTAEERAKQNPLGYEPGDIIGATGVEHAWESYLRGTRGWEKRVVDARGRYRTGPEAERILDQPVRQEPLPGRDLRLTLDVELETAVEHAMRNQRAGAVVVVDVRTGRILSMFSKPDFDPNDLAGGGGRARERDTFRKLYADPLRPILDKAMSGAFQPGSTFKPFSALAALEDHLVDPEETEKCDGYLAFGRRLFHCTHVHGKVDMRDAIGESCNVYFFKLAMAVGMDRIAKIASDFGLGQKTGLTVNPEAQGRVPTRSWYALRYRGQFRLGFTLNSAIGEGATTVTPLQLALAYAALANGGTLYEPEIVRAVETSDGGELQDFPPRVRRQVSIKPENMARVTEALSA
ncbi:MAG TPA: penicillin-binding protein 2, partial [Polyangiaceae bacterium]